MPDKLIYNTLRKSPLFESIDEGTLKDLIQQMELVRIEGGETLIQEGEPGECMYVLQHGRLLVSTTHHGKELRIGEIGVGDVVGEMSLLTDLPRSASVKAVRDCFLIKITRETFESIVQSHPHSAMEIVSSCVKRLQPSFKEKKHRIRTLTIVPCEEAVDDDLFIRQFKKALEKYIKVKVITCDDSEYLKYKDRSETEMIDWLSNNERENDLVVYVADPSLSEWSRLCLRQADKLMLLTLPNAGARNEIIHFINDSKAILTEKDLIIMHPADTKLPHDTSFLLQKFECDQHFHVAKEKDYERLARFMLGRAVCLVFSGGGLRGIAHHGIIKAFHERGIPIDMTAGTSFGSLAGVFTALGASPEEMYGLLEKFASRINKVVDLTLPVAALSKGQVLYELLTETLPEHICLEDLWLPTFTVATNITEFEIKVNRHGPAWEAIRSSLSIPGIFPPVVHPEGVLVDGASMNNLPVDLMRQLNNEGTVIASVASGQPEYKKYKGYEHALSGWSLAGNLFGRNNQNGEAIVPGIAETMLTASLSASTFHQEQMESMADFCFDLDVSHFKLLDVKKWEEICETGYQNAVKYLDEIGLTAEKLRV